MNDEFVKTVSDNLVFEYAPGIEIPPDTIYFVKMYAEQQMRTSDLFVWFMQVATESFSITVNLEGDLTTESFAVIARPMHHGQHSNFAVKDDDKKKLSWRFEHIVLPYPGHPALSGLRNRLKSAIARPSERHFRPLFGKTAQSLIEKSDS